MGWWLNYASGLLFRKSFFLLDCDVCVTGLSIFLQFLKSVEKGRRIPVAKHGSGAFSIGFCVLLWRLEWALTGASKLSAICTAVLWQDAPRCPITQLVWLLCFCCLFVNERRKENFQKIGFDLCGLMKNVPIQTEHEAASWTCGLPGDSLSPVFQLHSGHPLLSSALFLSLTLLRTWGKFVSGRSNQALLESHEQQHSFSVQSAMRACYARIYVLRHSSSVFKFSLHKAIYCISQL